MADAKHCILSTTTGAVFVDTNITTGVLTLPSTSLGKSITLYPANPSTTSIWITTTQPDLFETEEEIKQISLSSQTHHYIPGQDYKWYEVGGMSPPAFQTSSLSTLQLLTASTTVGSLCTALQVQQQTVQLSNAFTPLNIPGCILWLDANDSNSLLSSYNNPISTTNTAISFWLDKSPAKNDFYSPYNLPLYQTAPGDSKVYCPASDYFMRSITKFPFPTSTFTLFATVFFPSLTSQGYFLGGDPDGSNYLNLGFSNTDPAVFAGNGVSIYGNPVVTPSVNVLDDRWHLYEVQASNGILSSRIDSGRGYPSTATIAPFNGMTINGVQNTLDFTYSIPMYITDVLLYSTSISDYDRQRIEGYLSQRKSIQLPTFHPYRNYAPIPPSPLPPLAPPFSPSSLSSCIAWFSSDDLSTIVDGGAVISWKNRMRPQTPASTLFAPVYSVTDNAIYFNGAFRNLPLDPTILPQGNSTWEALVVARNTVNKESCMLTWGTVDFHQQSGLFYAQNPYSMVSWTIGDDIVMPISCNFTSPNIASHNISCNAYAPFSRRTFSYNDTQLSYTVPPIMNITSSYAFIGNGVYDVANYNPLYSMGGYIYDILLFTSVLDVQQRQAIDKYYADKYNFGYTFPSNHPAYTPRIDTSPLTSAFTPLNFSSLTLWLDGKDPLANHTTPSNTSPVPIWYDKSRMSTNAIADSNSAAPFYGFPPTYNTSLSSLTFSQTSNTTRGIVKNLFYRLSNYTLPYAYNSYTIFVVGQAHPSISNNCVLFSGNPVGERWELRLSPNSNETNTYQCILLNGHQLLKGGKSIPNTSFIHCITYGGGLQGYTIDPFVSMYINGSLMSYNIARDFFSDGRSNFIGRSGSSGNQLDGDIQEIIMFTSSLTTPQRQQVEGYLSHKWNISLPIKHPYVTAQPPVLTPLQQSTFTPTDIPGLKTWLDASDPTSMTLVGSTLTAWKDKSPASTVFYTPSDSSSTIQISTTTLFGNPSAAFNGNTFLFTSTFTGTIRPQTTFYVTKNFSNGTLWQGLLAGSYSNQNDNEVFYLGTYSNLTYTLNTNNAQTFNIGYMNTQGYSATDFGIPHYSLLNVAEDKWFANYSLASSSNSGLVSGNGYIGNYQVISTLVIGARYMSQDGVSLPSIVTFNGNGNYTGSGFNGYLSELLVYNQELSTDLVQKVEGYLAWKWGMEITLPPMHPYRYTSPSPVNRTPFTPALYKPGLWLDASTITTIFQEVAGITPVTDGAPVARWESISNLGFSTVQEYGAPYYPIWQSNAFNGKPGIVFTPVQSAGSYPFLYARPETMSDLSGSREMSLFVVATLTSTSQGYAQYPLLHFFCNFFPLQNDTTDNFRLRFILEAATNLGAGYSNWMYCSFNNAVNVLTYNTLQSQDNQFQLYGFTTDANQKLSRVTVNGTVKLSAVNSNSVGLGWCGANIFTIGSWSQNIFAGTIHEVIAYPQHLHDTDRMRVEGYLAWKWGFQSNLPSTHPFYHNAP